MFWLVLLNRTNQVATPSNATEVIIPRKYIGFICGANGSDLAEIKKVLTLCFISFQHSSNFPCCLALTSDAKDMPVFLLVIMEWKPLSTCCLVLFSRTKSMHTACATVTIMPYLLVPENEMKIKRTCKTFFFTIPISNSLCFKAEKKRKGNQMIN